MRTLASIKTIDEVRPIEGAERICQYRVGGWLVVDQVDKYKVGDLVIYCEVDSWIPHSLAPFLSKGKEPRTFNGVQGERLRTIKLRGALSQGLLLPLDKDSADVYRLMVYYLEDRDADLTPVHEGQDVTGYLGIQKWEKPVPAELAGLVKGSFPEGIPKTDQERIQNLSAELAIWNDTKTEWTLDEKLDGSSCTIYLKKDQDTNELVFGVCSRNLDLKETEGNSFWKVARKHNLEEKLRAIGKEYALQGELCGPGIQGNRYNLPEVDFFLFDVYDINGYQYMNVNDRNQLAYGLEIPFVPQVGTYTTDGTSIDDLLFLAEGKSYLNPKAEREGLVFRSVGTGATFKAISNKFLLRNEE